VKHALLPAGAAPRTIQSGSFSGLEMEMDLRGQTQLYLGLWEREVQPWVKVLSSGIQTAIDIGTAQGEYLIYFLKRTGATRVFSFEPDASVWPALQRNLALNGLTADPRIVASAKAAGNRDDATTMRLDSLAQAIVGPCLVKMDVDGGEVDVLEGARRCLRLPAVRWLVETHSPDLERRCRSLFEEHGYDVTIIDKAWWRLILPEHRPGPQNRWMVASK
jgi:hypothetical protein